MSATAAREVYVRTSRPTRGTRVPAPFSIAILDRFLRGDKIRLVNVSAGGFEATGGDHRAGEMIWIDLPGLGFVRSEVRWREGDRFGAAFADTENLRLRFINGLPPVAND